MLPVKALLLEEKGVDAFGKETGKENREDDDEALLCWKRERRDMAARRHCGWVALTRPMPAESPLVSRGIHVDQLSGH